jgi:alpha-L-arabinofuranosidase
MGALRASLGRHKPFNIRYVEIGNEDWARLGLLSYRYRWPAYYTALVRRYPSMTFIATTSEFISSPPAIDEHHYRDPLYFIDNFRHFDSRSRSGPKILVGEFSVENNDDFERNNTSKFGRLHYPTLKAAVAESVYRISFERNSDLIIGGCYAPVLQNVYDTQWTPNFIVFNASFVVKSTSYLAQQLFGQHMGNIVLHSMAHKNRLEQLNFIKGQEGDGKLDQLYFIATKNTINNTLIVKLANTDTKALLLHVQIENVSISSMGIAYSLAADASVDPSTVQNTFSNPDAASIETSPVSVSNGSWSIVIPSWSIVIITVPL